MNDCLYKCKIESLLDGRLTGHDMDDVSQHVQTCSACQAELHVLEQVDDLFRSNRDNIFPQPSYQYWQDASAGIARRIEKQRTPVVRWQARGVQEFAARLMAMLEPSPVRLGLVGLASLALLVVLLGRNQMPPAGLDMAAPDDSMPTIATPLHLSDAETQPPDQGPSEVLAVIATPDVSAKLVSNDLPASIKAMPWSEPVAVAVRGPLFRRPAPVRELMPVPAPAFIMLDEENLDGDDLSAPPSAVALKVKGRRKSQSVTSDEQVSPLPVNESDFAETMWIVQESRTLAEKKNIWLSYVTREKNPTYQKMGYYNLALVLANLVHETKDPVLAQDAIDFYVEHEAALRPQMKDQRYNRKLSALRTIAQP